MQKQTRGKLDDIREITANLSRGLGMHQVITINSIGKLVLRLKSHYIEAQAKAQAGAREGAGEVAKIGPRAKAGSGSGAWSEATCSKSEAEA